MSAAILNFIRPKPRPSDWTDQELAEFFRVADALTQAGFSVTTDRGVTDEGEPWFVFVREASDDVIAHFARIDGEFVADASVLDAPVRGTNLRGVLDQVLGRYTVFVPQNNGNNNLFMHPAALLTAFVATALMELERGDPKSALKAKAADQAARTAAGAYEESRSDGKTDAKGDDAAKTLAARAPALGAAGQTPVNAAGRAVTFNETGTIAEHSLHSTLVLTAVIAALGTLGTWSGAAAAAPVDDAADGEDPAAPRLDRPSRDLLVEASGIVAARTDAARAPEPADPADTADGANATADGTAAARSADTPAVAFAAPLAQVGDEAGPVPGRSGGSGSAAETAEAPRAVPREPEAPRTEAPSDASEPASDAVTATHALVEFEGVAVELEGLRALFDANASAYLREPDDSRPDDGNRGDTGSESGDAGGPASPPADGGDSTPGSPGSPVGGTGPGDGNPGESGPQPPDGADGVPDTGAPPSAADFVFSGSDSQHAVLRHVVDFVLNGQATATPLPVQPDTPAYAAAQQFAERDGGAPDFVVFDSEAIGLDVFDFMPGVIFVEEAKIYQGPVVFENEPVEIDLSGGGSLLLIGVADVQFADAPA